jgi:hypothetical protein
MSDSIRKFTTYFLFLYFLVSYLNFAAYFFHGLLNLTREFFSFVSNLANRYIVGMRASILIVINKLDAVSYFLDSNYCDLSLLFTIIMIKNLPQ